MNQYEAVYKDVARRHRFRAKSVEYVMQGGVYLLVLRDSNREISALIPAANLRYLKRLKTPIPE